MRTECLLDYDRANAFKHSLLEREKLTSSRSSALQQ